MLDQKIIFNMQIVLLARENQELGGNLVSAQNKRMKEGSRPYWGRGAGFSLTSAKSDFLDKNLSLTELLRISIMLSCLQPHFQFWYFSGPP